MLKNWLGLNSKIKIVGIGHIIFNESDGYKSPGINPKTGNYPVQVVPTPTPTPLKNIKVHLTIIIIFN